MPDDREPPPPPEAPPAPAPYLLDAFAALDATDPAAVEAFCWQACPLCRLMDPEEGAEVCRSEGVRCFLRDPLAFRAEQITLGRLAAPLANPEMASDEELADFSRYLRVAGVGVFGLVRDAAGLIQLGQPEGTLRGRLHAALLLETATRAGVIVYGNVRGLSGHRVKQEQEFFRAQIDARLDHQSAAVLGKGPGKLSVAELSRRQGRDPATVRKGAKAAAAGTPRKRHKPRGRREKGG